MHSTGYYSADACDLGEFTEIISQTTDKADVPHASAVEKNIPIYDMGTLRPALEDATQRQNLMAEWAQVLLHGAGIVALKGAYADTSVLDEATDIYENIIAEEKEGPAGGGDHFAAAGANDRIWNSLQKLCEKSPDVFLRYFANAPIAAICEAWLGPNYQMTAQVNLVHPGGAAQQAHRDYHLGFQSAGQTATYPAHVHDLSPVLTLQGAVAHCDMSVESGPTKLLPFSQTYRSGYAACAEMIFAQFSRKVMCNFRCPKAMRSSLALLFFMPLVPIRARTFTAWQICCRYHRPLGARWRPLTATRCATLSTGRWVNWLKLTRLRRWRFPLRLPQQRKAILSLQIWTQTHQRPGWPLKRKRPIWRVL